MSYFQTRVAKWMQETFGPVVSADAQERCFRFGEEAIELLQACGCSKEDTLKLVNYVYGRPVGEPFQEVGGTMVTLAALCEARDIDFMEAAHTEQTRCELPEIRAKIQAKQASKRAMMIASPLPGSEMLGKFVTLQLALGLPVPTDVTDPANIPTLWLPQRSVWRIVGEESKITGVFTDGSSGAYHAWIVEHVPTALVPSITGRYALPKHSCSEPREAA